ncbi:MAG TPA: NUDIX hydrolase [Caulobacteraceae bacterium]
MSPEASAKPQDQPKSPAMQYAALPWRQGPDGPEVLLVTSRETRRWVIPKGWPMKRRHPWDAAALEAFEEAGVRGEPERVQFGAYRYDKVRKSGRLRPVKVRVFRLQVAEVLEDWPERAQRERAWVSPAQAAERVVEPELKALLLRLA